MYDIILLEVDNMKKSQFTKLALSLSCIGLSVVVLATSFAFVRFKKPDINAEASATTTNVQESSEPTADENVDETISDNDNASSVTEAELNVESESHSNKQNETSTTAQQSENTANKNTSVSNSNTATVNKNSSACSHKWGEWKTFGDYDDTSTWYEARVCSKCGTVQKHSDVVAACNHSYGNWIYRNKDMRYRVCSKCDWQEEQEGDFRDNCMGSKSEYLEMLGYINEARREAGLNELVYCSELQSGADIRAKEIAVKYSHTRPNGQSGSTAFDYSKVNAQGKYIGIGENILSGTTSAKSAFNGWMNSPAHKGTIMKECATHFVVARCDRYWIMITIGPYDEVLYG